MTMLLVVLLMQCPDGTPPPCARATTAGAPGINSVAVLLFGNVSRDSAWDYLSDGLATEIATTIARVPRLEVRSPGAVRSALRGADSDPRVIARRLNVRYLVEGDYQRGGDRIRISVRLVAAPSGTQRWSESYTRPVADLLAVQEEIARNVATAIAGELLPQERRVLTARPTRNPEAHDRFLRGNFYLARRTPAGVTRAIEEYSAALRLDSEFATASARIALAYALFIDWGWDYPGVPRDSLMARGLRAARAALALDSANADAWMGLGYLESFLNPRSFTGSIAALRRATSLDPRNAEAWHQLGSLVSSLNQLEESNAAMVRALELEPGRAVTWIQYGNNLETADRDPEARAAYDSSIAADPEFYVAYAFRTFVRLRAGDMAGAGADAEAALRYSPANEEYYGRAALAAVAARQGDSAAARSHMARAVQPLTGRVVGPLITQMVAMGFVAAGQPTQALDWLERTEPIGSWLWISMQFPQLRSLRADPRFERLMAASRPAGAR